jgi:uncharacterized protein YecE (DUF72 family)
MGTTRVGTCSWTEKALIESGEFYPKGVRTPEARLRFYAEQFDTVEIDSAYYAIPSEQNVRLWAWRTPDHFIFHVKAYGALTGHGVDPRTLPSDILSELPTKDRTARTVYLKGKDTVIELARRFKQSIYPLAYAGKLGVVLFQFPPNFRFDLKNMDTLLEWSQLMSPYTVAVEFRDASWLAPDNEDATFHFLRKHQIPYVCADEAQSKKGSITFVPAVTAKIAYVRFHGRSLLWSLTGATTSQKYGYDYSEEELRSFVPAMAGLAQEAETVFLMFNNHGSPSVKNASVLKMLMASKLG